MSLILSLKILIGIVSLVVYILIGCLVRKLLQGDPNSSEFDDDCSGAIVMWPLALAFLVLASPVIIPLMVMDRRAEKVKARKHILESSIETLVAEAEHGIDWSI